MGELKLEQERLSDAQNVQVGDNGSSPTKTSGEASPLQRQPTRQAPHLPASRNSVRASQGSENQTNYAYSPMQSPKSSVRSSHIATSQTNEYNPTTQAPKNSRSNHSAAPSDSTYTAMQSGYSQSTPTPHEYTPMTSQSKLLNLQADISKVGQVTKRLYPDLQETKMAANMAEYLPLEQGPGIIIDENFYDPVGDYNIANK